MAKIQKLPREIAQLIAAGEVVERPASVVKELLENAVDAGASEVTLEIQNGGIRLIRVTDNGCGIARDDVPIAFLSHATSKIHCIGFKIAGSDKYKVFLYIVKATIRFSTGSLNGDTSYLFCVKHFLAQNHKIVYFLITDADSNNAITC